MERARSGCMLLCLMLFLLPSISRAKTWGREPGWSPQSYFLERPNTYREYENFGWERYREYSYVGKGGNELLTAYNTFGEPWMLGGWGNFVWEEFRTLSPDFGSRLTKSLWLMNETVIARDSYKGWSTRLTAASFFRTAFTSLTLNLSRFDGIRWDNRIGNHEFTVALSRPSDPVVHTYISRPYRHLRDRGTTLMGGHWEGSFLSEALRLGATAINLHRFDSLEEAGDLIRGIAPAEMVPDTVVVRFMDDSPSDGIGGGAVFDIRATATVREEGSRLERTEVVEPVFFASPGAVFTGRHWEANGPEFVEYRFVMPPNAVDVRFDAVVGNDYKIAVRQSHWARARNTFKKELRQTPLVTVLRAEDNVMDLSNRRRVSFRHGLSTGMNIVGFNGELNLVGLHLRWEYARSVSHFQYPVLPFGKTSDLAGDAYYIQAAKRLGPLTLGGELFSIDPKYSSYAFDSGDFTKGKIYEQTTADYVRSDFEENTLGFYFNELQSNPLNAGNVKRYHVPYLVGDNDDDDPFPDQSTYDWPRREPWQMLEAGVYPGLDEDQDGVPDNNRNNNQIPDYLEPFFKYWQEPDDFYWGDDFNNNGIVDRFEDDSLPDYPYYKDERGSHLFLAWRTPVGGLELRLGGYDADQIAGGGQNKVYYGRLGYLREFPGRGKLEWYYETKRVRDDIRNGSFRYQLKPELFKTVYTTVFMEDELTMRDSLVNRGFLRSRFSPLRNVNLINNVRYELNSQQAANFPDGSSQADDRISFLGVVNKVDYTFQYGDLVVKPMLKHLFMKKDVRSRPKPLVDMTTLTPILTLNYRITDRTSIQAGAEGMPLLSEIFSDRVEGTNSFSSQTYILQGTVKGMSAGFNVFFTGGIQYTNVDYDEPGRESEGYTMSFLRVTLGEQVLAASQ